MGLGVGLGYVVKSIFALVVIIFIANYSLKYLNTFMTKKKEKQFVLLNGRQSIKAHQFVS